MENINKKNVTEVNINDEREVRLKKLSELRSANINPYPASADRKEKIAEALKKNEGESVQIVGRIMMKRDMGKLTFCHLQDESARMQIVFKKDDIGEESYKLFTKKIDLADIISVKGARFVTHKGEQSVLVSEWSLLSKALLPLPDKFHGLQNEELRYRKRYLDLLLNPDLREVFYKKSKFWDVTRSFMKDKGFFEVETPYLEVTTGGAEANPFKTYHRDYDMDVYLRISIGELWQKRLMAAGYEKTFEIGRVFRNEGSSPEHLQEFTNMEFYWAYKNYTEEVKKQTGVNILEATEDEMKNTLKKLNVRYEGDNRERLTDTLWKYCRKNMSGPAFLVNHPKLVSPLSKQKPENPLLTERFQIIIAGSEVGNGFSELNDPVEQRERFEKQRELIETGDEEAMMADWEFVEMLEHGMPPTCGFGFGERVFSFLENKPVRETQFFPLVRPRG